MADMTLEASYLIANAVIIALLLVGGFYLRQVVFQQLKSKDATIELLQTQISSLTAERAPAIAAEHATMIAYANQLTKEKQQAVVNSQRLSDELARLIEQGKRDERLAVARRLLYESKGLLVANEVFQQKVAKKVFTPEPPEISFASFKMVINGLIEAFQQMNVEVHARNEQTNSILGSISPESKIY
jgi:hypothetical protein